MFSPAKKAGHPRLKAKAADTRHLIPFAVQVCAENLKFLGPNAVRLVMAVDALHDAHKIIFKEPKQMAPASCQQLQRSLLRFLHCWKSFGCHQVFKHHMVFHVAEFVAIHGNPKYYWTYADENENRLMGTVAKSLHAGATFYTTLLQKVLPDNC